MRRAHERMRLLKEGADDVVGGRLSSATEGTALEARHRPGRQTCKCCGRREAQRDCDDGLEGHGQRFARCAAVRCGAWCGLVWSGGAMSSPGLALARFGERLQGLGRPLNKTRQDKTDVERNAETARLRRRNGTTRAEVLGAQRRVRADREISEGSKILHEREDRRPLRFGRGCTVIDAGHRFSPGPGLLPGF